MNLNYRALAKAISERRAELGLSRREASEISRRLDVEMYDGAKRAHPGLSERQWQTLERDLVSDEIEPRRHTLLMVDGALRWPEGTANAILRGLDRPQGVPVLERLSAPSTNGVPSRSEFEHARADVAELRAQVADIAERVDSLPELVQREVDRLLRVLNGGR